MKGIKIIELLWVIISAPVWIPAVIAIVFMVAFLYTWHRCWFGLTCANGEEIFERILAKQERRWLIEKRRVA